jgi:small neutral amino acid transporter SnatA (MarC family)
MHAGKAGFSLRGSIRPGGMGGCRARLSLRTGSRGRHCHGALPWRIAMNSFFLLVGSYFVETYVLVFFGISLPVVQVGGGMIVIGTGWTLLKQRDDEKHDVHRTVHPLDTFRHAFYPLTMPLTVGPGSISVAITLGTNAAHHHSYHPLTIFIGLIGLVLIAISISLCYGFADRLARILGANGDDGNHAIVVVLPGLYRCADCLERGQRIAGVGNAAFRLTKNTSPAELQTG